MNLISLHQINRGIERVLRDEAVRRGHWVDPLLYLEDDTAYHTAIDNIPKKQQAPVFSGGTGVSRGEIDSSRIVINRIGTRKGQVTLPSNEVIFKDADTNTYRKSIVPRSTRDILYEVRTLAVNNEMDVALEMVIIQALSSPTHVLAVNHEGQRQNYGFMLYEEGEGRLITYERIFERLYSFVVRDVWLGEETAQVAIPAITQIKIAYGMPYPDGEIFQNTELNF